MLSFYKLAFFVAVIGASFEVANGQESNTDSVSEPSEALSQGFARTAKGCEFKPLDGEAFQWNEKPLFTFSNEGMVFGSVFVWTDSSDRLAVIGTIGSLPIQKVDFEFVEFHLLKPVEIEPVTFPGFPQKRWSPSIDELARKPIRGAPSVAPTAPRRLVQMRSLVRRFEAGMVHKGANHHLRLLPQPLFRYPKSTQERDGALFAMVWENGTDPELVLRIEVEKCDGKLLWCYQPVRFTWRELRLQQGDQEVWTATEFSDRDRPEQTSPYLTGLTKTIP